MATPERQILTPPIDPENAPFWDAAGKGKLLVGKCNSCNEHHFYPRSLCPFCFSDDVQWVKSSGQGVIYSYSVMRRANPPYVMAYVELDEGVRMISNIVESNLDELRCGLPVRAAFRETADGVSVPVFKPA